MDWTLPELTAQAASVLSDGLSPQVNGRIRDLPNERMVRWYVTIGLVDPPLSRRGRVARYGLRHLLQVVAVKRRQAAGCSIAEIQAELAGATDATLRMVARLDPEMLPMQAPGTSADERAGGVVSRRPDDRADRPASDAEADEKVGEPDDRAPGGRTAARPGTEDGSAPAAQRRFWAERPGGGGGGGGGDVRYGRPVPPARLEPPGRPERAERPEASGRDMRPEPPGSSGALVHGIRLAPGATLLVDVPLSPDDAAAILGAAAPLINVLTERGLL